MQKKWYRSVLAKDIDAVNGMNVIHERLGFGFDENHFRRIDGKEGREDSAHEHGHAGE